MKSVTAKDGAELWFATHGDPQRPALFMGPHFYATVDVLGDGGTARWVEDLSQDFFVIIADYPRGFGRTGTPVGMDFTPDFAAEEYGRIADAAGVGSFGWVGYSYGGAMGVQVAARTGRVSALAVGGFPPLNAPFRQMVDITRGYAEAMPPAPADGTTPAVDPHLAWSSVGFYTPLVDWPEGQEVAKFAMPRLAFMGTADDGVPAMGITAPLAGNLREAEADLRSLGWQIAWLEGEDHMTAITPEISLPVVRDFFRGALLNA